MDEHMKDYRPLMKELRKGLDERGIEWTDLSDSFTEKFTMRYERTKFDLKGIECSVIYGVIEHAGGIVHWSTYGAPVALECWYQPNCPEPIAMTVEEILEMVDRYSKEEA